MMRVLLVTPAYVPATQYGGPITKIRLLCDGLLDAGVTPVVWTTNYGSSNTPVTPSDVVVDRAIVRYHKRFASYRWSPVSPQPLATPVTGFDVVHVFGYRDPFTLATMHSCARQRVPFVVEPMGMLRPAVRKIRAKELVDRSVGVRLLRHASAIIATSFFELKEILEAIPDASVWVRFNPLGTLPPPKQPANSLPDRLVTVGRISRKKNLELAVRVAAALGKRLDIIGPDEGDGTAQKISALIKSLGVSNINILGPKWGSDLHAAVKASDLYLSTSMTENFGQSVIEAAALGVPPVATPETGASELLRRFDCGISAAGDLASFCRAVQSISPSDIPRLGGNGAQLRQLLDAATVTTEQVRIYEAAIRGDRR